MSYSSYDHDNLEPAETMKIERRIYFEDEKSDISGLAALPLAELLSLRAESAAAEQEVFDRLKELAAAWEEQAGKTLSLDKALEYARTPPVQHTSNQWEQPDSYRHIRSNAVYQMSYSISENTRYDRATEKSIPYSWTLNWHLFTNAPGNYGQAKIAGQKKVFDSREALDKYLNGRIKAHQHLFTEISPPIPKEYADYFKVNGLLLPGYTVEGEPPQQAAQEAEQKQEGPEPEPASAAHPERSDRMSEVFSIMLDNRAEVQNGGPHGCWLDLPTTAEKLQEAMREIHITADNPQDFFINGYSCPEDRHLALPYDMVLAADVDELNFLAARLETLDAAALAELNAVLQNPRGGFENIGQIIDYADNVDYFVHIPDVQTTAQLGSYYLNRSGMVDMPEEWKAGIDDTARFGAHIAKQEQGAFTPYGYLVKSGDEWQRVHEGQPVPEEYRVMAYPTPEILREESKAQERTEQTPTAEAKAPQPVTPIILNSKNSADRMKEITDRLETGIQELFESDRFRAYLDTMARFHNYSFNNTILIAMQGGQLVAGYNKWRDEFHRNVKKGEKGIKIFAPAPYKVKKDVPKLDAQGQPVKDKDGNTVTEQKEVQVPAFKIVSVFDVSQTEGEPLPSLGVEELTGSVEQYQDFFKALEQTSPVPIGFEDIPGGSHGYYHLTEKRIAIQEGMSELQTLKTAIHEIAHSKLHAIDPEAPATDRPDSRTREVQAESVAYTVCQHYGLDTSDYSFGYVAGWSSGRDLKELKASLETIRATAHELITTIDGHLAELQQQRQAKQEQTVEAPAAQAAEQPNQDSVFSKLPPEQQAAMTEEVRATLQALVDADLNATGQVSQGTKDAIHTQGFTLSEDGTLEKDLAQMGQPEQENEAAYRLDDGTTLYIQTSEDGFDFTLYGPDFKEIDGGLLDDTEYYFSEARDEILSLLDSKAHVTETLTGDALADFQRKAEQANAIPQPQSRSEQEIAETGAGQPALDPAGEPVVTILFTESPHLENGQKIPLHEADALFAKLDAEHRGNGYYDKTDFRIDYIFQGEAHSYSGRQDFGDREGSLLTHIRSYQEFYLHDENWKDHVLKYQGGEIPYMEQHCNLSRMEQEAQRLLQSGEPLPPEQAAYLTALVDYVKECRPLLNQGEPLPEPPNLSDFDRSLQDYKEQVRAEVAQEAEAAGLTVEEYLASGSQAPEQPNFSIYQVPPGPEGRDYRYRSYAELRADGLTVDRANYQLVYTAPLDKGTTLDDIFRRFNMEIPPDFKGHSLSMSDIIVFRQEGQQTAYYVDEGAEYRKVPEHQGR